MKKINLEEAESLAYDFRNKLGLSPTEPVQLKKLLLKLNILTRYRSLSERYCGLSIKAKNGRCFMLINSNIPRGRQHHTIAHELYHLFYDTEPKPHFNSNDANTRPVEEVNADMFASALLMPRLGISDILRRLESNELTLEKVIRMEQYFGVSHKSMLVRLDKLKRITTVQYNQWNNIGIKETAQAYGYPMSLYENGNNNLMIGDYKALTQRLFEECKISEGYYNESLNLLEDE